MFLNAAKSFSSLREEITDSLEFELLPRHIEQAEKLENKVNNRVRNVFKLAFASVMRDLTEAVSVSEVHNDDSYKKRMTLKHLQEGEDLKKKKDELKQWKQLKEDLSWKEKLGKIMEAKGIYYRKVLLKKKITLKLVRWFKKRMGIKAKLRGDKMKKNLHLQKYKLMKPLIVRRLLKDIIACGFYSFMRERLIDILYDRKRKQLNKMKKAEKKYKNLVKFYQQKLAEANKFAVARRKIRERLIQLKILRIKTDVKSKVFKHMKRLGFSTTREAEDFHSSAMKHLQRLQKTGLSSTDNLVHFKSLNSDTFIRTVFLDLAKQGKINARDHTELSRYGLSPNSKARLKIKMKQPLNKTVKTNVVPLLKKPITKGIETESKQKSSLPLCKLNRSSIKVELPRNKPFIKKYRMNRHRREKKKNKSSQKTNKTTQKLSKEGNFTKFKLIFQ
ncbi:uncharacterized protein LOC106674334 [Cimex lectularius]|uniref:Uncharacterized protein n=1 Tax=Cimex lectularius TaxID=79782 RepID=A0A8I6SF23_CIMLE|nr:uncharacterized protein LOC106674334 [Cimex lectularius]